MVLYGGGYSILNLEELLHGDINLHSTNQVEVLIPVGSVSDARTVEYMSVLVSKLETVLDSCI